MREIQNKHGDGYIGSLMGDARAADPQTNARSWDGKILFQRLAEGMINSGGFDLNGMPHNEATRS